VKVRCFVSNILLRQWSCSHWIDCGNQLVNFLLPNLPVTSQFMRSQSLFLSMSLLWPSPLIHCGQVSPDTLICDCPLFSRPPEYLSFKQEGFIHDGTFA
jgi:hypothetical protein